MARIFRKGPAACEGQVPLQRIPSVEDAWTWDEGLSGRHSLDDAIDDGEGDNSTRHSSLVSHESDDDSFQREFDTELDRQLDDVMGEATQELDNAIQQHITDQLNAQYEDYMEEYFHRTQQEEDMKRGLQVQVGLLALSKESKESSEDRTVKAKSVLADLPASKYSTTTLDVNAQIQQVIDQYKATQLHDE